MQKTLVATVGLSAVPLLLSLRTLQADTVLLVHTDVSESVAKRIAAMAPAPEKVELLFCGDGEDMKAIYDKTIGRITDAGPFVLDYTGGTSAMVAALVIVHHDVHGGDVPGTRVYQDYDAGLLVSDAGSQYTITDKISIRDIINVNGFSASMVQDKTGKAVPLTAPELSSIDHALRDWEGLTEAEALRESLATTLEPVTSRRSDPAHLVADEGVPAARPVPFSELRAKDDRAGLAMEFIVARLVLSESWDEIAYNVEAYDKQDLNAPVAEFDAVLRRRHRLVAVEVKSSAWNVSQGVGLRVAATRTVLGGATRVALVSRDTFVDHDYRETLSQLAPLIDSLVGFRAVAIAPQSVPGVSEKPGELPSIVSSLLRATAPALDPAGLWFAGRSPRFTNAFVDRDTGKSATIALGGTAMSVTTATQWAADRASPARWLGPQSSQRSYTSYLRYLNSATRPAQFEARMDFTELFESLSDAALTDNTYIVTTGPKVAAAAATAHWLASGREGSLAHLSPRTTRSYQLRKDGSYVEPMKANIPWNRLTNPELVNAEPAEFSGHHSASIRWLANSEISEGFFTYFTPAPEWNWWPPLYIANRERVLVVVAPNMRTRKANRQLTLLAEQFAGSFAGEAAGLVILLSSGDYRSSKTFTRLLRPFPTPIVAERDEEDGSIVDHDDLRSQIKAILEP